MQRTELRLNASLEPTSHGQEKNPVCDSVLSVAFREIFCILDPDYRICLAYSTVSFQYLFILIFYSSLNSFDICIHLLVLAFHTFLHFINIYFSYISYSLFKTTIDLACLLPPTVKISSSIQPLRPSK